MGINAQAKRKTYHFVFYLACGVLVLKKKLEKNIFFHSFKANTTPDPKKQSKRSGFCSDPISLVKLPCTIVPTF